MKPGAHRKVPRVLAVAPGCVLGLSSGRGLCTDLGASGRCLPEPQAGQRTVLDSSQGSLADGTPTAVGVDRARAVLWGRVADGEPAFLSLSPAIRAPGWCSGEGWASLLRRPSASA